MEGIPENTPQSAIKSTVFAPVQVTPSTALKKTVIRHPRVLDGTFLTNSSVDSIDSSCGKTPIGNNDSLDACPEHFESSKVANDAAGAMAMDLAHASQDTTGDSNDGEGEEKEG